MVLSKPHFLVDGVPVSRVMVNIDAQIAAYKERYPDAEVVKLDVKSSSKTQVALLSKTTVLIAEWGGTSFGMVFLPPGAELIILEDSDVGHIKAGMVDEGNNGMESTLVWQWFSDIGHIQNYKFQEGELVDENNKQDSSTQINPVNMFPYIDRAMRRIATRGL